MGCPHVSSAPMAPPTSRLPARLAWGFILLLLVLRHDVWLWNDRTLVFGFLPIGLLWQAMISLGAGLGWYLVSQYAWPDRIEEWASEPLPGDESADEVTR